MKRALSRKQAVSKFLHEGSTEFIHEQLTSLLNEDGAVFMCAPLPDVHRHCLLSCQLSPAGVAATDGVTHVNVTSKLHANVRFGTREETMRRSLRSPSAG